MYYNYDIDLKDPEGILPDGGLGTNPYIIYGFETLQNDAFYITFRMYWPLLQFKIAYNSLYIRENFGGWSSWKQLI